MKTTLIKLQDKFILVSDETIATGDYVYESISGIYGPYEIDDIVENPKKIIAGIPELPSINFSLLSEEDCKRIGWIYIEKLPEYNRYGSDNYSRIIEAKKGFKAGFKTAQSLNDKQFSLEDIKNAISFGVNTQHTLLTPKGIEVESEKFIQSLQQTSWDVEVEIEDYLTEELALKGSFKNYRPKITNNSIKVIKIL